MEKPEVKSFSAPEEVREFPNGRLEVINMGGAALGRGHFLSRLALVSVGATAGRNQ